MKRNRPSVCICILAGAILIGCNDNVPTSNGKRDSLDTQTPTPTKNMTASINLNDVIKHIYPKIDEGGLEAYRELSEPERVFFATWPAGCEICNGGFPQYYRDSYAFAAVDCPEAYRRIGATGCAHIVESANQQFGESGPARDRTKRKEQLDKIPSTGFEKLEDAFLKCDEDTTTMLEEYVAENIEHFSAYSNRAE